MARAGMVGLGFKKLLRANVPASFVWVVAVGGLGYFFGASWVVVRHYFRFTEVALLIGIGLYMIVRHGLKHFTK
ncbi:hypothetical protein HY065_02385 [Candidatus Berkelbacteria bacterium]|nr:hypothetical protein [Candidatus Berkelbacteria bacterium]